MTRREIKAAATKVLDLLGELAGADGVRISGEERDEIDRVRDLCDEICADTRWEE